jgi:cation:H+ antiporter
MRRIFFVPHASRSSFTYDELSQSERRCLIDSMFFAWSLALIAGVGLAALASAQAIKHVTAVAASSKLPPFLIGTTLVAIGTDLPEIANSITASLAGHGDLNVGDSIGSAATQITLVLGLIPFLSRTPVSVPRRALAPTAMSTAATIGLGLLLFSDGYISRLDGLLLVLSWPLAFLSIRRWGDPPQDPSSDDNAESDASHGGSDDDTQPPSHWQPALAALGYFALVGVGAAIGVLAFVELAAILGVPEYLISFFAASLATSLPELLVGIAALRTGQAALALGDAFGSSLVDTSLSVGIGPLIAPTPINAELATRGSTGTLVVLAVVTTTLMLSKTHNRFTGTIAIAAYFGLYALLLR